MSAPALLSALSRPEILPEWLQLVARAPALATPVAPALPVRRRVLAGHYLYRAGQPFHALLLLHAGFVRTAELSPDGHEQVTGFRMRGEWLGLESIGLPTHAGDAVALDQCEVWELPWKALREGRLDLPEGGADLPTLMAAEIRRDRARLLALGAMGAEQRVAAFLLDLAARHEALGYSDRRFLLRMSRCDIASYLVLKHETVTRALSHLRELGAIDVRRREVRLRDPEQLRRLVGGDRPH